MNAHKHVCKYFSFSYYPFSAIHIFQEVVDKMIQAHYKTYQHPLLTWIQSLPKGVIPLDHIAHVGSLTSNIRVAPRIVLFLFVKGDYSVPNYKSRI